VQVFTGSAAISAWSAAQNFTVACGTTCSGFNENFSSSATNWVPTRGTWNVAAGCYYCNGIGDVHYASYYNATYSDIQFDAMVWRDAGSSDICENSLLVRGNPSSTEDKTTYDFAISRDGKYEISVGVHGHWTQLQSRTSSSYINKGSAWNKMTVWVKGDVLWFGINDHWVWNGTDASLSSGKVGVHYYGDCGGAFWVDYARVTCLTGSSATAPGEISQEQRRLNETAWTDSRKTASGKNGKNRH
jgi:hypothetical protein